jgi:hypothetical protein
MARFVKKPGITFIPHLGITAWDGNQITAEQVKVRFRSAIKDSNSKMPLPTPAECTSIAAEISQLISCSAHKAHKWDIARTIEPMAKRAWRNSGHTGRIGRTDKSPLTKFVRDCLADIDAVLERVNRNLDRDNAETERRKDALRRNGESPNPRHEYDMPLPRIKQVGAAGVSAALKGCRGKPKQ